MDNIAVQILLIAITIATCITYIWGLKKDRYSVKHYKNSIRFSILYNLVLLLMAFLRVDFVTQVMNNIIPVVGLFIFRNIYVEFYKAIKKDESFPPLSIFVRVVPYIYMFIMFMGILQEFVGTSTDMMPVKAFDRFVVAGMIIYQFVVFIDLFILNRRIMNQTEQKYHNSFMNNLLAIVVYLLVLVMNIVLGTIEHNIYISGIVNTVIVGFIFVNHVHEDALYETKLFQKNIVQLSNDNRPESDGAKDSLTGVYTREYFIRHIKTFDKEEKSLSVVVVYMTGLRLINGSFGYEYGDEILQEISMIICEMFKNSTIARMSGSTFAIMQTGLTDEKIIRRINTIKSICSERDGFVVDLHFGYFIRNDHELLLYDIYRRAEEDLYHKKSDEDMSRQHEISDMLYTNFGMLLPTLSSHLKRCSDLAEAFARHLKHNELLVSDVKHAALLHDIALTFMPEITEYSVSFQDEFDKRSYKSHAAKGYDIAVESGMNPRTCKGIRYHHERWDGKGYPEGLKGNDIPAIAQIVAIAEMVDMIIHYGVKVDEIEMILKEKINVEFSEEMVYNMIGFLKHRGIISV